MHAFLGFAPALSLLGVLGCGPSDGRGTSAAGMVMVDGEPLSGAVITFEPMGETKGPKASSPVFDGRFEIGIDAGLQPSTYRVRVSMLPEELLATVSKNVDTTVQSGVAIAPEYDSASDLRCELVAGPNDTLKFDVAFLNTKR